MANGNAAFDGNTLAHAHPANISHCHCLANAHPGHLALGDALANAHPTQLFHRHPVANAHPEGADIELNALPNPHAISDANAVRNANVVPNSHALPNAHAVSIAHALPKSHALSNTDAVLNPRAHAHTVSAGPAGNARRLGELHPRDGHRPHPGGQRFTPERALRYPAMPLIADQPAAVDDPQANVDPPGDLRQNASCATPPCR